MPRTTFTAEEIAYLDSQPLARIATADRNAAPRVVPTGFSYNAETGTIDCGGYNLAGTRRYRDVQGNPQVAIVIDDLASTNPWRPRSVTVRGTATLHDASDASGHNGPAWRGAWMRITPTSISSMGIGDAPNSD